MRKYINWDAEALQHLYWEDKKSTAEIAIIFSVSNRHIRRVMEQLGIPRRTRSEAAKLHHRKRPMPRSRLWGKEELVKLYCGENKSTREMAEVLGSSPKTVSQAMQNLGIPLRSISEAKRLRFQKTPARKGSASHTWKGGRINSHGYIKIHLPEHPYAINGYVFEHRLVMEKKLHRYLMPWEKVHHKDGVRNHNVEGNLEVLNQSDHRLKEMFCQDCPMRKEIRLIRWQIKQLQEQLQYRLKEN